MSTRDEINEIVKSHQMSQIDSLVKTAQMNHSGLKNDASRFSVLAKSDPDAYSLVQRYWTAQRQKADALRRFSRTVSGRQMPTNPIRFGQQATPKSLGRYSNGKMIPSYSAQPAHSASTANVTQAPGGKFDFRSEAIKLLKQRGVTGQGASGKYTNGSIGSKMRDQYKDVLAGKYNEQQQRAILEEWKKNLAYARPMNSTEIAQRANDPAWNTKERRSQLAKSYMPNTSGTSPYSAFAKGTQHLDKSQTGRGATGWMSVSKIRHSRPKLAPFSLGTGGKLGVN